VLAARARVGLHAQQREQRGGGGGHALAEQLVVRGQRRRGRGQRAQDGERQAGRAAGRVDGDVGRGAQARDARGVLARVGEAAAPGLGHLRGLRIRRQPLARGVRLVDPRPELRRRQPGELQCEVPQVALRIDGEGRNAVDGQLLEQRDGEARLAAAGHAHDDPVRGQVAGVIQQQLVQRTARRIVAAAEVEHAELFVVLHARDPR
jgi:hypothetical protein